MPSFPPPPPKKRLLSLQYTSNYIGKITRRGQCTHCNISQNCVSKCTKLHLSAYSFKKISGGHASRPFQETRKLQPLRTSPPNDKSLIEPFLQVDGDYSNAFQITGTKPRAPTLEGKGKGTLTLIKQWKDKGELMGRNSLREKPKHSRKSPTTYGTLLTLQHTKVQVNVQSQSMRMYLSVSEPKGKSR